MFGAAGTAAICRCGRLGTGGEVLRDPRLGRFPHAGCRLKRKTPRSAAVRHRAYPGLLAKGRGRRSGCSRPCRSGCRKSWRWTGIADVGRATASSRSPIGRHIMPASPSRPQLPKRFRRHRISPIGRDDVRGGGASLPPTKRSLSGGCACNCRKARSSIISSKLPLRSDRTPCGHTGSSMNRARGGTFPLKAPLSKAAHSAAGKPREPLGPKRSGQMMC